MTPGRILLHLGFITAAACSAVNSGCAALSTDCGQNWYEAGAREALFGTQAWDVQYAASCGTKFDRGRYVAGWQAGVSQRPALGGM